MATLHEEVTELKRAAQVFFATLIQELRINTILERMTKILNRIINRRKQ